jgi:subtilisin family serine protease
MTGLIGIALVYLINLTNIFKLSLLVQKSHGTRCAGEVAAKRDNGICGVGVAYDSKIAGIRMLDQPYMTDLIEANSMGHEPDLIDIYSASWGPTDDGKTVDGPRNATMRAIVRGVNEVYLLRLFKLLRPFLLQ